MYQVIWIGVPFVLLLAAYCVLEQKELFRPATALKVVLSAFVAVVAWAYAAQRSFPAPLLLMAVGLTLAVPADYFLQYIKLDGKRYEAGILCFAGMHICLLLSFVDRYGVRWLEFILFAVILLVLLLLQTLQKWDLGAQKLPLSVYTVLVGFMAAKAISAGLCAPAPQTLLAAAGGLCFLVSDMILGVWSYHDGRKLYVLLNRIVYFTGQLLFAFSIGA